MKQNTYCLISHIPELDWLWHVLESIRRELVNKEIPHQTPKLQWHVTHITPFEATPVEISWLSLGLKVGASMFSHNGPSRLVRTTHLDLFEDNDTCSLVIRLEIDE